MFECIQAMATKSFVCILLIFSGSGAHSSFICIDTRLSISSSLNPLSDLRVKQKDMIIDMYFIAQEIAGKKERTHIRTDRMNEWTDINWLRIPMQSNELYPLQCDRFYVKKR